MSRTFRVRRGYTFRDGVPFSTDDLNAAALPVVEEDDSSQIGSSDLADGAVLKQHVAPDQYFYAADSTGGANTYIVNPTPALNALEDGIRIWFRVGSGDTNTGASTINVSGVGSIAIKRMNGQDLLPGDLRAGQVYALVYNTSSYWVVLNPSNPVARHASVSAGTSPDYTVANASGNELTALYTGARQSFRVHADFSSGTATLDVDGLGAKPINKDDDQAAAFGDLKANAIVDLVYDISAGASGAWMLVNARPPMAQLGLPAMSRGLRVGRTSATAVLVTARSVALFDSAGGDWAIANSVSQAAAITTAGAGGLDTGSEDLSTLYYVWLIWDGATLRALLSESDTAPTMPSGYTFKALVGSVYNDGSGDFEGVNTYGDRALFESAPVTMPTADTTTAVEVTHRLGGVPAQFHWVMVCLSADLGFAVGEEVPLAVAVSSSGTQEYVLGQYASSTIVGFTQQLWDTYDPQIPIKSGGASYIQTPDKTKWAMKAYAER